MGNQIPVPVGLESDCLGRVSGINHKNGKHGARLLETRRIKSQFRAREAGLGHSSPMGDSPGASAQGNAAAWPKSPRNGTQMHFAYYRPIPYSMRCADMQTGHDSSLQFMIPIGIYRYDWHTHTPR